MAKRVKKTAPLLRYHERGDTPWVFPTWSKTGHLVEIKSAWKRIIERAGLVDIRPHDLRRTLGSWLAIQGYSLPVIGAALGHKSLASTQVYARLTQAPVAAAVSSATDALLLAGETKKPPKKSTTKRKAAGDGKAK